ncbi:Kef-type K+ transport system membrane component KefB [Methanomicrobium sp. W14]|uniref:cation:proton antiporter n=1 Tax=Methanomicrobium sp. W14 TaxID=2817839 RepID=UPI001AE5DDB4|nr:cation:proton antiporter [Methanomicrobium sp. W14]MBP2133822.1 Kef-type K+ transport system membrane component KefB [Methanomicrobium sp. W14]
MSIGVFPSIEFQMSLLLFVALGGYLLASKINQSAVVGEILIGLLVGPSFLGLITYTDFVQSIASLGAVILMFVIGFEFSIKEIGNLKFGIIGFSGVVIPWIGGYLLAISFGFDYTSSLFIGTALTATSIAITANVLREMCLLNTGAAKAIIGAAVIDDVLSLLALSVTSDIASGSFTLTGISITIIKQVVFLAAAGAFGIFFISKWIEKIDGTKIAKRHPEFVFIFAVMIAFLYATLSEYVGISAIIGAFIAGVSFNGIKLKHSKDIEEGAEYLYIIFASIFFVSLGILVDISVMTETAILFLVALTVLAVITKLVGCAVPARIMGYSNKDSLAIGFGMSPRGEVAMIVALMGLNLALIGQEIYVSIVLMSLITTIITPIIFRNWIYKKEVRECDF